MRFRCFFKTIQERPIGNVLPRLVDRSGLSKTLIVHHLLFRAERRSSTLFSLSLLSMHEAAAARPPVVPRLARVWADGVYAGRLVEWAEKMAQFVLDIVCKPKGQIGFSVLPWRWIVERTFAWLGNYRRLARDYEINPRTSEAWIKIAMIHLMVRRLA